MQLEKVKPATGVPFMFEIGKLGTRVKSTVDPSGFEFRYEGALMEGHQRKPAITYLSPAAQSAIERTGAQVGDLIRLVRARDESYSVSIIGDAHEPAPQRTNGYTDVGPRLLAPRPNGNGHTAAERQAALAQHITRQQPQPAPAPAPMPPPSPAPKAAPVAYPLAPGGPSPQGELMGRYLIDAIHAKRIAEAYAASVGDDTRFESDDVRALAITMWIEDMRRGDQIR